ncbi:MAG TPA: GGDEF domain-containing protein, partial [Candidatus Limnocylindria bacterium]|nr:GGDEF domain-containing protein [Candidatus Limnocylindria bacterium]
LLGAGAAVAAVRSRRQADEDGAQAPLAEREPLPDKYDTDTAALERRGRGAYSTAVRVLWWVSIAAVLIGVGLSDAYDASQAAIYAVGAVAVGAVVLLHDLLPDRLRNGPVVALEVALAIGLTTAILVLTGYGSSPFVFGYHLVAVAVALALGGPIALMVATLASLAFLGVIALDPAFGNYTTADLLRLGLQVGSIWLLAYVAGVFASGERRMRATVLQMSRADPLTGLYNRGQLFPTLEQEVQRTRRSERGFCLLMIDLDGLKAVNDSYGHHRGDEVLRLLGGVIRHSIRLVDTAYRYGGDEFLVLLPETDFAGAFVVAEKIRAGTEEMGLAAGDGELLTSVSIGLVSCPEDGTTAEELMIAADRAMYQAKSLGKNQVSGNPRPRRLPFNPVDALGAADIGPPAAAPEPVAAVTASAGPPSVEVATPAPEPPPAPIHTPPVIEVPPLRASDATAFSVAPEVEPITAAVPAGDGAGNAADVMEDDEADPTEVRRQIAAARRNMDPDHQIRRAMDAFLSPTKPNGDSGN